MIHPETEVKFINKEIGYGVVAKTFIPKGTITWVLDEFDRKFSPEEFETLGDPYQEILRTYSYRDNQGNLVLCWDNARFVNHSFNANCLTTAYDFEFAIKDILPGEQLTDDYGYLNIAEPFRGVEEGTKRKTVYPDDLVRYHRPWDIKLRKTFKHLTKVDQPLRHLFTESKWRELCEIEAGKREMNPILNCYFENRQNGQMH
tara:strand:+ start:181 stop:786 length:606 start_codon:yes stop_codon:yes gene_type:complete